MALSALTISSSAGVNYNTTTDSSVDWTAVTNNSYFYDKTTKLTYYKTSDGIVVGAYDTFTGGTVNGLTANTISATTYQNLPTDVNVTGGTYSSGTITFTNNTGGTFSVTGLTTGSTSTISGDYLPLSGGTVTGGTIFQSGLTANTISADTLTVTNNIDTSLRSLYNNSNNVTVDWQNSQLQGYGPILDWGQGLIKDSGPTLSIDWINRLLVDNGEFTILDWQNKIMSGMTNIQSSTISATTYQNLPDNVTGNYLPLSGGTVSGNTTITANLTVSGNSGINWFSSNTSSDLVRITQTGVGNAFVVEDNTNPDSTPFIINSGGSTNIGSTTYLVSSGGIPATLQVSNGTAGAVTLPIANTPLAIQSNSSTTVSLFSPNAGSSQFSFGSPSDSYASIIRYSPSITSLLLSTTVSGGLMDFQSGNGVFAMRINSSQNIGIGTTNPSAKLHVVGDELVTGTLTATTISATTYQNLPDNVTGRYLPLSGGTVTGNTIFTSGLTANTLNVTGNTNVKAFTGTTGYISGSGQNILTVIGSGNSTTSPLFSVQGSSGELFSVTDSLVGSLFSVNDISGLPIMEVFSDNTTLWGSYQAPSLNTTTRTSLTAGTNTIYSIPTSAYTGAFYEYTLISSGATGARAGQIMSIWSGSTANFTETTTTDIGTTTGVTFTVAVSGNNAVLSSSATTAGWTVKTIIRSI